MKYLKYLVVLSVILTGFVAESDAARRTRHQKWLLDKWCREHKGETDAILQDRTRCDCLTWNRSIKMQFRSDKWRESIGTVLHYTLQTGLRGGIVLILESEKDLHHWIRLNSTIKLYDLPIDTWKVERWKKKSQ